MYNKFRSADKFIAKDFEQNTGEIVTDNSFAYPMKDLLAQFFRGEIKRTILGNEYDECEEDFEDDITRHNDFDLSDVQTKYQNEVSDSRVEQKETTKKKETGTVAEESSSVQSTVAEPATTTENK